MPDPADDTVHIILYITGATVLLLLIAVGSFLVFGSAGLTILDVIISAILTAALVILYFRQTSILKSQRNLLNQELNREARQQHTETLRKRVRIWHGNPDQEVAEDLFEGPDSNTPTVQASSFEAAPFNGYTLAFAEDEPFRVIPSRLQGDRYLQDLLANHAPDLRETKEEIQQLHARFDSLREEFLAGYDSAPVYEMEEYTLEPDEYFNHWLFRLLVRYERGILEDVSELRERAHTELERGGPSLQVEDSRIWIRVDIGGGSKFAIYGADFGTAGQETLQEYRMPVMEEVEERLDDILDRVEHGMPYKSTVEAAEALDEGDAAIERLEQLLVEYDGRPIYPGDCKYLEEARI